MIEAGVLPGADAVLDAGVGAVAGFEEVQLAAGGVGGQQLVAPAVGLLQRAQLRAGDGAFAAAEDPHVGRPVAQPVPADARCAAARSAPRHRRRVRRRGRRGSPSRSHTCCQSRRGHQADGGAGAVRRGRTRPSSAPGGRGPCSTTVMWLIRSRVAPAPSTVTSRSRRCGSGICAIASVSTAMWSAAVFEPALPGSQQQGQGFAGVVTPRAQRVMTVGALERAGRALLVRVRDLDRGVQADHHRLPEVDIGHPGGWDPPVPGRDQRPHAAAGPRPRGGDPRRARRSPISSRVRHAVGSEATGPYSSG